MVGNMFRQQWFAIRPKHVAYSIMDKHQHMHSLLNTILI